MVFLSVCGNATDHPISPFGPATPPKEGNRATPAAPNVAAPRITPERAGNTMRLDGHTPRPSVVHKCRLQVGYPKQFQVSVFAQQFEYMLCPTARFIGSA